MIVQVNFHKNRLERIFLLTLYSQEDIIAIRFLNERNRIFMLILWKRQQTKALVADPRVNTLISTIAMRLTRLKISDEMFWG